MIKDKELYSKRLSSFLGAAKLHRTDLYSQLKEKQGSMLFEDPSDLQIQNLQKFFKKRYPQIDFRYIIGEISNPNVYINTSYIQREMTNRKIGINTFNSYIESETGVKNACYLMTFGIFPGSKKHYEVMMDYIFNMIDENGNRKDIPEEEPTMVKDKKEKKTTAKYITDPDNYIKNEVVPSILRKYVKSSGWNLDVFSQMVFPERSTLIKYLYEGGDKNERFNKSISKDVMNAMSAALNIDFRILEGKTAKYESGNRYFPRNEKKSHKLLRSAYYHISKEDWVTICENVGFPKDFVTRYMNISALFVTPKIAKAMYAAYEGIEKNKKELLPFDQFFNIYEDIEKPELTMDDLEDICDESKTDKQENDNNQNPDMSGYSMLQSLVNVFGDPADPSLELISGETKADNTETKTDVVTKKVSKTGKKNISYSDVLYYIEHSKNTQYLKNIAKAAEAKANYEEIMGSLK
jgi:hypothetical protein